MYLAANPVQDVPGYDELVKNYGPWLGLIVFLVLLIVIFQFYWFMRTLRAKDAENQRLIAREKELNDRLLHLIDGEIGFKKKK